MVVSMIGAIFSNCTSTAFATVKKAVEAIEATTEGSNTIKIVGEYAL